MIGDYEKEIAELEFLAEQGDASAQFLLGWMYEEGKRIAQNDKKAIRWYSKSAQQGVGEAQLRLGMMYAKGERGGKDYKKAKKYCREAMKNGFSEEANYYLGFINKKEKKNGEALEVYSKKEKVKYKTLQYNLFKTYKEISSLDLRHDAIILRIKKSNKNLKLLSKLYLTEKPREWKKEFGDYFFEELDKLYGNEKTTSNNRPKYYANFINKYIYKPMLNGEILRKLSKLNPIHNGIRKQRHHQFFREELGVKVLRKRIAKVIKIMKMSANIKKFKREYSKLESRQILFNFINDE